MCLYLSKKPILIIEKLAGNDETWDMVAVRMYKHPRLRIVTDDATDADRWMLREMLDDLQRVRSGSGSENGNVNLVT
jgi:hypothetical protein